MNVADTELMADKLGIINLCKYCYKRIELYPNSIQYWIHLESKRRFCCDGERFAHPCNQQFDNPELKNFKVKDDF